MLQFEGVVMNKSSLWMRIWGLSLKLAMISVVSVVQAAENRNVYKDTILAASEKQSSCSARPLVRYRSAIVAWRTGEVIHIPPSAKTSSTVIRQPGTAGSASATCPRRKTTDCWRKRYAVIVSSSMFTSQTMSVPAWK